MVSPWANRTEQAGRDWLVGMFDHPEVSLLPFWRTTFNCVLYDHIPALKMTSIKFSFIHSQKPDFAAPVGGPCSRSGAVHPGYRRGCLPPSTNRPPSCDERGGISRPTPRRLATRRLRGRNPVLFRVQGAFGVALMCYTESFHVGKVNTCVDC